MKSHHLYFLSNSICSSGNKSHASKKEKEMIARYVPPPTKRTVCCLHQQFFKMSSVLLWDNSSNMFCITSFFKLRCLIEGGSFFCAAILLISCRVITFSTPLTSFLHLSFLLASSLFCKLAALIRHRISLFGKDSVETLFKH